MQWQADTGSAYRQVLLAIVLEMYEYGWKYDRLLCVQFRSIDRLFPMGSRRIGGSHRRLHPAHAVGRVATIWAKIGKYEYAANHYRCVMRRRVVVRGESTALGIGVRILPRAENER